MKKTLCEINTLKGGDIMKKAAYVVALFVVISMFLAGASKVEAYTYDLNCEITGGGCVSLPSSYGTLTLEDGADPTMLNVYVDLYAPVEGGKMLALLLNFDYGVGDPGSTMRFSYLNTFVDGVITSNGESGGSAVGFDIDLSPIQGAYEPVTGTLSLLNGSSLSADNFNLTNTDGLYASVHIGNIGENGEDSIWLGSGGSSNQVPEPSTLLLLGSGLVGLGFAGRRKKV